MPELSRERHAASSSPSEDPAEHQHPVVADLLDLVRVVVELGEVLLDCLDEHLQALHSVEDALAELGRQLGVEVARHQGTQLLETLPPASDSRPVEAVDAPDQVGPLSHARSISPVVPTRKKDAPGENRTRVAQVKSLPLLTTELRGRRELSCASARTLALPSGRPATMTIGASHLALRDLASESIQPDAVPSERQDSSTLLADVVELQDAEV